MDTVNVNIRNRFHSSKKNSSVSENAETTINIGDNLFSLMLVTIAAFGVWAVSAVLFL